MSWKKGRYLWTIVGFFGIGEWRYVYEPSSEELCYFYGPLYLASWIIAIRVIIWYVYL
jgi:hypothetical protein